MLGHPVHQLLIVLPLGLLAGAMVFDTAHLITHQARWAEMACWMIGLGVATGLLAAVFGVIDWLAIPSGTRAKAIGAVHAFVNVVALVLFAVSFMLRYRSPNEATLAAHVIAFVALAAILVGGWFGGELVNRLGVGVDDGAHLNAPNSLTSNSATGEAPKYGTGSPKISH